MIHALTLGSHTYTIWMKTHLTRRLTKISNLDKNIVKSIGSVVE